jgi:putative transcriptional regulator
MSIKINLKEIREIKNISQFEFAKLSEMSPQNIQKLEQGRAKGIQFDVLNKLCDVLNCEVKDLIIKE